MYRIQFSHPCIISKICQGNWAVVANTSFFVGIVFMGWRCIVAESRFKQHVLQSMVNIPCTMNPSYQNITLSVTLGDLPRPRSEESRIYEKPLSTVPETLNERSVV